MSDLIKTAETVAFNPATNSVCILTPRINGDALSFKNMCYTDCTRAEIECALDASGMHFSNRTDQHGLIMFEILNPSPERPSKPDPTSMSPQNALSLLPWVVILIDADQLTFYCRDNQLPPSERHWQVSFTRSGREMDAFREDLGSYSYVKEKGPRGITIIGRKKASSVQQADETLVHD